MTEERTYWVVMKVQDWHFEQAGRYQFPYPIEIKGPPHFLAVFPTREEAVAWNDGREDAISQIQTISKVLDEQVPA